jgi:NAD(P)-dependent dehydrogenase (short-subunit alcohol dehydrogenase family)
LTVGCVDRAEEGAKATTREIIAAGGKAEAITCDVTNEAEVNAAVD